MNIEKVIKEFRDKFVDKTIKVDGKRGVICAADKLEKFIRDIVKNVKQENKTV